MSEVIRCPWCRGSGQYIRPCPPCRGTGFILETVLDVFRPPARGDDVKLYLLTHIGEKPTTGAVVIAPTKDWARRVAAERDGWEGWSDPAITECQLLGAVLCTDETPRVVLHNVDADTFARLGG